jgi:glycosyltransferase involved in cell wall biosynthesis
LRVLHVVGGMNRGGIETWLMHVLRQADRGRCRMDFVVHTDRPCAYDDEIRALGGRILPCPAPNRTPPWGYSRAFRRLLAEHGPYDVVHSHLHFYGGNVLRLAHKAGVPVRIAHSHCDVSSAEARGGVLRRGYRGLMRHWVRRHATAGLAASRLAAADLFGPAWESDPRWRIFYCGIDLSPFHEADAAALRPNLGQPEGAFVIGHVGRFAEQKNHAFLVEIAAEVAHRDPQMHLLLVGEGELRAAVEEQVRRAGLAGRVTFAGARPDVPRLMLHAMDVFVLPSLYEGLPVVGLEAQAAGLPLVTSDAVTPEVARVPHLVRRLPLSAPASAWADAVLAARDGRRDAARREALAIMAGGPFDIRASVRELERLYLTERQGR